MKKNNDKRNAVSLFGEYIKKYWRLILLIAAGYSAVSAVNFLNIATSQTIASFSLDDFELGQIADRDIIAPRDIGATFDNPLTVQKGERIIRSLSSRKITINFESSPSRRHISIIANFSITNCFCLFSASCGFCSSPFFRSAEKFF